MTAATMTGPVCQVCGGRLERRGGTYRNAGRWPRWCSAGCRRRGRTDADRARHKRLPIPASLSCPECRSTFAPARRSQRYCSILCRDRHNRAVRRSRRPLRIRIVAGLARRLREIAIALGRVAA